MCSWPYMFSHNYHMKDLYRWIYLISNTLMITLALKNVSECQWQSLHRVPQSTTWVPRNTTNLNVNINKWRLPQATSTTNLQMGVLTMVKHACIVTHPVLKLYLKYKACARPKQVAHLALSCPELYNLSRILSVSCFYNYTVLQFPTLTWIFTKIRISNCDRYCDKMDIKM